MREGYGTRRNRQRGTRRHRRRVAFKNVRQRHEASRLEALALRDEQTACFRRPYLERYFARRLRDGDHLLFIDLDDFKTVNETYGHDVGDALLAAIARALMAAVGQRGFVVSLGGDEFCVLLYQTALHAAEDMGQHLVEAAAAVVVPVGELSVSRTASVGCAALTPGMQVHHGIIAAERALLEKKRQQALLPPRSAERAQGVSLARPSLEEVRLGLQRGEIGYHVQPIVNARTLQVNGFEALIRWERPNGEILGPALFLDTMTKAYDAKTPPPTGPAHRVARWAVRDMGRSIAFNVSTAFLRRAAQEGLDWVQDIVGDIPYNRIVFELVETAVEQRDGNLARVVDQLRAKGIRVALDDFGTGHSTLSRLRALPVDIVKIDRSFVARATRSPRDLELLRSMIALIRSVGAESVCEGIETQAQLETVRLLGTDCMQGFLLGKPRPIEAYSPPRRPAP